MTASYILKVGISRDEHDNRGGHHGPLNHAPSNTATSSSYLPWLHPPPHSFSLQHLGRSSQGWNTHDGTQGPLILRSTQSVVRGQGHMDRHCYTDTGFLGGIKVPHCIEVHLEERVVQTATFRMGHEEWGFPGISAGKESACNAGDPQFDSWVRRNPWRRDRLPTLVFLGFPDGSDSKVSTCNAGVLGSIPRLGKSPEGGHGNPVQYSSGRSPMDRGGWWAVVHGVAKSWTQLSD